MKERFAKYMLLIFIIIEIGMFTHKGESGQIQIGPLFASEISLFLLFGLFYSSVIAAFLVFMNPFMLRLVRIVGYVGAFLFIAAMTIYNHDLLVSHILCSLGIILIPVYLIGMSIQLYLADLKKRQDKKGEII